MDNLVQDIRYGARMLVSRPSFTFIAALALALGIGANSAIFSVINAVLLQPLRYKESDQLVMLWHSYPKLNLSQASLSAPSYVEYRDHTSSFEQVAAGTEWSANLTGVDEPERVQGAQVSWNFFPTLGLEPMKGRNFLPEEDQLGNNRVVVMSYGLWKRRFGGDAEIVGKTVTLNGIGYNVVGVMPSGVKFILEVDLYTPISFSPDQLATSNHGNEYLMSVARLRPGVTLGQARAEMEAVAERLRADFYGPDWGIAVVPLREQLVGDLRLPLLVLIGAVGLVLLIACSNVANLLLARATSRRREIAVRTALGASRLRIVRQLLTESVLLSLLGGVAGLLIAFAGIKLIIIGVPSDVASFINGWDRIRIDRWVLGFTLALSTLTGLVFGLAPALQASRPDMNESLKEGGRTGTTGVRRNQLRGLLVVFETAIALILLIGAGLLIRSFIRLQKVDPGFDARNVITMQLALPQSRYKENQQISAFYEQVLNRVGAVPGAELVGAVNNIPMGNNNMNASFQVEGLQVAPGEPSPHGDPHMINPDYFRAMGIRLLKGRFFNDLDTAESLPVAIIDESLARQYWPNEDPIGRRMGAFFDRRNNQLVMRQIVGVVGHVKQYGLDGKTKVQYYFPMSQRPQRQMSIVVRSAVEPTSLVAAIKGAIRSVDSDQPIFSIRTMEQVVSNSMATKRFATFLLGIFSGVALLLAAVGLYGVMSYSVTQRTHEIGIRIALGAQTTDVIRMVVGHGARLAGIGVFIGLAGAFAGTRVMASLLFNVGATDPVTFIAVPAVLGVVALLASYIPARRATKVDPMIALRYE